MTDAVTPPPQPPLVNPQPPGRGLKVALAISVALNLAVVGLVAGAWLSGDGPRRGMPRDLGFGPFSEALSREDRKALMEAFRATVPDMRSARAAARAEFETLISTLRASPFDPQSLGTALAAIETRNARRLELGRSLIEERIAQMSDTDRQAFADRLEMGLRGKGPKE